MPLREKIVDADMPRLFQAADATSLRAQSAYVNGTGVRLTFIVLAAATGIWSWRVGKGEIDLLALVGVVFFVLALLTELYLWQGRPDRTWYDGRAVAESAKTLAWKFAVGAEPFPLSMDQREAQRVLLDRLDIIRKRYEHLELAPITVPEISAWMNAQRETPFTERRLVYLDERLRDQRDWYSAKQKDNRNRATRWRWTLVGLEASGAAFSLVGAVAALSFLLPPTIAALAGAVVAWLELKQHDQLARAYSAAVDDLSRAEAKLHISEDEETWALEVNDAEDAISREHTLWLASRSQA